jgi:hypothetical protein
MTTTESNKLATVGGAVVATGRQRALVVVALLAAGFFRLARFVGRVRASRDEQRVRRAVLDVGGELQRFPELRRAEAQHVDVRVHDLRGEMNVAFVPLVEHRGDDDVMPLRAQEPGDVEHAQRDVRLRIREPRRRRQNAVNLPARDRANRESGCRDDITEAPIAHLVSGRGHRERFSH